MPFSAGNIPECPQPRFTNRTEEYEELVELTVSPEPDSIIRIYMTYASSYEYIESTATMPHPIERSGFTVVEWGESELENKNKISLTCRV